MKPKEFSLDITPTYASRTSEDGGNENIGTYVLSSIIDNQVISSGQYKHSIFQFLQGREGDSHIFDYFERKNLKKAIIQDIGYDLHPELVSNVVDLHFLLKNDDYCGEVIEKNTGENSLEDRAKEV